MKLIWYVNSTWYWCGQSFEPRFIPIPWQVCCMSLIHHCLQVAFSLYLSFFPFFLPFHFTYPGIVTEFCCASSDARHGYDCMYEMEHQGNTNLVVIRKRSKSFVIVSLFVFSYFMEMFKRAGVTSFLLKDILSFIIEASGEVPLTFP